jgi:tetratricopeptide (TPR) repeat protein
LWKRAAHLANVGHSVKALDVARRSYALAPASANVTSVLAFSYQQQGNDSEALKYALQAADLGYPDDQQAWIYERREVKAGRYGEAAKIILAAFPDDPDSRRAAETVRLVYAALANPVKRAAAISAIVELYSRAQADKPASSVVAITACVSSVHSLVLVDAIDEAFEVINRCIDDQPPELAVPGHFAAKYPFWFPEMRPFRRDPRFQTLATRIGLMSYYQQYGPPDGCTLTSGKLTCQ